MYTAADLNYGMGIPTMTGNAGSGFGVSIPDYGAGVANPVNNYVQSMSAPNGQSPVGKTGGINDPGGLAGSGLGFNLDTGKLALGGLQTLGSLWQAFEANKLAKEQFKFQKGFANTNLANSIQSYNTTLEDRSRSRAFTEGQTPEQAQAYLAANRLPNANIR